MSGRRWADVEYIQCIEHSSDRIWTPTGCRDAELAWHHCSDVLTRSVWHISVPGRCLRSVYYSQQSVWIIDSHLFTLRCPTWLHTAQVCFHTAVSLPLSYFASHTPDIPTPIQHSLEYFCNHTIWRLDEVWRIWFVQGASRLNKTIPFLNVSGRAFWNTYCTMNLDYSVWLAVQSQ